MATPREAVSELRQAIASVRAACGADPSCRHLLSCLSDCEEALKEVSYSSVEKYGDKPGADDKPKEAPSTPAPMTTVAVHINPLRDAAGEARRVFAERRKSAQK